MEEEIPIVRNINPQSSMNKFTKLMFCDPNLYGMNKNQFRFSVDVIVSINAPVNNIEPPMKIKYEIVSFCLDS